MRIMLLCAFLSLAGAQDWESGARALRPRDTSAQQAAVLDELEQRARTALDRIPQATTQAEAEKARQPLRARLEESLGFRRLPWPPNLQASVADVVPGAGYRIDKNQQIDFHIGFGLDRDAPSYVFGIGYSFRFDGIFRRSS